MSVNDVYEGMATAGYAPEEIKAYTTAPADFDPYWANALAESRNVPLEPTMELIPERCTDKVDVYQS